MTEQPQWEEKMDFYIKQIREVKTFWNKNIKKAAIEDLEIIKKMGSDCIATEIAKAKQEGYDEGYKAGAMEAI